jgi:hypothetical protein
MSTLVYLNAHTDHDYSEVPRYAVLNVTPELIERLRVLRSQVIANDFAEVVVWAFPEKWGGGDEEEGWRTEADQLAVSVDGFLYRCNLKHTTVLIETEFLGIDELADGIAEGKRIFGELDQDEILEADRAEAA